MVDIARALANQGMPEGDLYSLPSSPATFPDGAHFRVELSGIETLKVLDATIDEAQKLGVPFHRAISVVRGATLLTREELSAFARLARDAKVEVIMTPGPRPGWDIGRQVATPEGAISGFRLRGMDSVRYFIMDIQRCLDLGFRGFLVWDEGVLSLLNGMKENGDLPNDIIFKMSVLAGHANPAGVRLVESLGAASCNPVADLTLPMLAAIRHVTALPLDIHIQIWSSMGGFNRFYEAPEIARVAAPCYFKMEPGPNFAMYLPWANSEDNLAQLGREKIRWIKNIIEIVSETHPDLKVSAPGVADLTIPLP